LTIKLGSHQDCIEGEACAPFAADLHSTLSNGNYNFPVSLLSLEDFAGYTAAHRTARKRAARAARLGYTFGPIERSEHIDAIHGINTSAPERQGRPMTAGYVERPSFSPLPDYPCTRHAIRTYGVSSPSGLVAYIVLYICGELALVSQILGHAEHLKDEIMYLLVLEAFRDMLERSGPVQAFYNRHDSGTDGLRFFKERLGFEPARVEWEL